MKEWMPHILLLGVIVAFVFCYLKNIDGLLMWTLIGIPAFLSGYLYAKRNKEAYTDNSRK